MSGFLECVRNTAPLALALAGLLGYLLVRMTRRVGFKPTGQIRLPWPRREQRVGRRMVVPVGRVPRRHRAPGTIGGIKQW